MPWIIIQGNSLIGPAASILKQSMSPKARTISLLFKTLFTTLSPEAISL